MIDGVFYDAFNYAYDIPEVRPWGRPVTNIPGCNATGGLAHCEVGARVLMNVYTGPGCEALLTGTLEMAARTTKLLNDNHKAPMFGQCLGVDFWSPERDTCDLQLMLAPLSNLPNKTFG